MPYTKQIDRTPYFNHIENVIEIIATEPEDIIRAEYIGYYVACIASNYVNGYPYNEWLNNSFLDFNIKNQLFTHADNVVQLIMSKGDLLEQAGDINYNLSAVIWGLFGDALGIKSARYGFRVYVKSMIENIINKLKSRHDSESRRNLILQGVLSDVIDETYRRKTANYEDQKIAENGDVWPLRQVSWKEEPIKTPYLNLENE